MGFEARLAKLESLIRALNARLTTARGEAATPSAHATSHSPGGSDTLSVYYATTADFLNHKARHAKGGADALDAFYAETLQKLDDFGTPDDNTDLNATTARHGLLLKLGGGTTNFLRADGAWASPGGGIWTEIAEATPTSGTNVEFASIAAGYTEFRILAYIKSANTGIAGCNMNFNNAGGTAYDWAENRGGYTAAAQGSATAGAAIQIGRLVATDDKVLRIDITITNIASMTKHVNFTYHNTQDHVAVGGGRWNETTNEISNIDIDLTGAGGTFVSGSRIWLLGRTN